MTPYDWRLDYEVSNIGKMSGPGCSGESWIWLRPVSYISPLTYAHDAVKHGINGSGNQSALLDMLVLPAFLIVFLLLAVRLYRRVRRLGY